MVQKIIGVKKSLGCSQQRDVEIILKLYGFTSYIVSINYKAASVSSIVKFILQNHLYKNRPFCFSLKQILQHIHCFNFTRATLLIALS